jgi:biopolymer transport protein ExbD
LRLKANQSSRREIDMIMLIDVVFLMLIFFLVAASIKPFAAKNIDIVTTAGKYEGDSLRAPLFIGLSGDVFAANHQRVEPDQLAAHIAAKVQALNGSPLQIVADRNVSGLKLVEFMELAKAAGAQKMRLVAKRRRQ